MKVADSELPEDIIVELPEPWSIPDIEPEPDEQPASVIAAARTPVSMSVVRIRDIAKVHSVKGVKVVRGMPPKGGWPRIRSD
ncbi:hypothetical protein GCM10010988_38730 [Cnuibacter physcomitrellae]|nr:hypothetical protein GCM10010988_38730 [Cnuibacter physcomitrellae]